MKTVILLIFSLKLIAAGEPRQDKFFSKTNQFAASLYEKLSAENDGNLFTCPFSVQIILALAQSGAKGKTGEEMRRALHFANSPEEISDGFSRVLPYFSSSKHCLFYSANKIYIKKDLQINDEFKNTAVGIYNSSIENIDFCEKIQAMNTINNWVQKQTENKIHNIISGDVLNDDTVAVLINTLYFKGEWKEEFKQYLTQKKDFFKTVEDVVQVDTMYRPGIHHYRESKKLNAAFLKLPFKGHNNVSMIIVLPNEKDGLSALEENTKKAFKPPKFKRQPVNVYLPKFKIETNSDLKKSLQSMGMKKAFARGDFSGIAGRPGEISISDILQKTYISVNEVGIEAAAATAVNFHARSLMGNYGKSKNFIADHPFLFYIRVNNIIVFTGRVKSPL